MTDTPRDAPDRVWVVRQVAGPGYDHPRKANKLWQPVHYVRAPRRAEWGFHVWKADTPVVPTVFTNREDAQRAGFAHARVAQGADSLAVHDLALRLEDVVPDPAERSRVRLGEGWRFLIVMQHKTSARGDRYIAALCEHDREQSEVRAHPKDVTKIVGEWGRRDRIVLSTRLGRLNRRQSNDLISFCVGYGMTTLNASSMPVKRGNRLRPKFYAT